MFSRQRKEVFNCENKTKEKDSSNDVVQDISNGKGQTSANHCVSVNGSVDSDGSEDCVSKSILEQDEADDRHEERGDESKGRGKPTEETRFPPLHSGIRRPPDSLTNIGRNDKNVPHSDCSDEEVIIVDSSEEDFDAGALPRPKKKKNVNARRHCGLENWR